VIDSALRVNPAEASKQKRRNDFSCGGFHLVNEDQTIVDYT
jgi:hypothetical protein